MNNILVTGADGQVGSELRELASDYTYKFFFTTKKDLDVSSHENVDEFIIKNKINVIINAAAYTGVDEAEVDMKNADKVNHLAVSNLAEIAKNREIKLIHISTDYVFDGKNSRPYSEVSNVNPLNSYGFTKLQGELGLLEINPNNSIIIRTSWLYSSYGTNFVKKIILLSKKNKSLNIVYDQVGSPTYAGDLAKVILDTIPKLNHYNVKIYNYSNEGVASWFDFAQDIIYMTKSQCNVYPILTEDYITQAKRPCFTVLSKSKIKKDFSIEIPYWKESLKKCLKKMGEIK